MDDEEQRAWIGDVKRRHGIRCIGDEEEQPRVDWPALDYVPEGSTWTVVSERAMVSWDGVNFYVKPEGMPVTEWLASLP